MATGAQSITGTLSPLDWLWQFLKHELAPYPGRAAVVSRMVIAATIVMLICMTFRIPYGFQGAIYTILISRESSRATLQQAGAIVLLTAIGAAYLLFSVRFVISIPTLHFLWIMLSLFVAFFLMNTMTNYGAAAIFSIMIAVGVPIWDRHLSAETNVEDTLRVTLAAGIGVLVTVAMEVAFAYLRPGGDGNEILPQVTERLLAVEKLLACYSDGRPVDEGTEAAVIRLGMLGTSSLRRNLARSGYSSHYAEQMGAVVALTGRVIEIAANITQLRIQLSPEGQRRVHQLSENIASIRSALLGGKVPRLSEPSGAERPLDAPPAFSKMAETVGLIPQVFVSSLRLAAYAPSPLSGDPPQALFVRDALSNIEHVKFAIKGCLTAGLCYVTYTALDWPGLSTSVLTCLLTALSTIGSSRQKEILRFAGTVIGGFVIGMGAQVFILPYLDSIGGFTILFAVVTLFAAWITTSSPRLSYLGLQVALAFYFINLQEFTIQTSLAVARDRVVGVLLGLFMMWLIFDRLWAASAVVEMRASFVSALRLLAQFAREPLSVDLRVAMDRSYSLRETIVKALDNTRAFADALLFEFGRSRQMDLVWRGRILQWQPLVRTAFLTRIALWRFRAGLPDFTLPEPMLALQRDFDEESAKTLDDMADRIEGKTPSQNPELEESFAHLEQALQTFSVEHPQEAREPRFQVFLPLSRRMEDLLGSLDKDIQLAQ